MLKVYPNAVPRGMDVYSLLSTMYNSKFAVFLPQFGCDFLDANDCSYAIILEPCYPGYTPLKKFVSEFSELANAELKCRLLARIFAKLFAFVKLSHEEECMGWFDYETLFLEAGYENLKFFHLGFHHDPNKTRQQKIVADYRQCARVLDVVLQVQDAAGGPVPETSRDDHKNSPTNDMIGGGAGGDNAKLRSKMMNLRQQPGALPSGYNQVGSMVISQEQIYDVENYNEGVGSGEQAQDAEQHEMALEGQEYYYQDQQVAHEDANVNEQDHFYNYQYAAHHLQHDYALSAGAAAAQGDYESGGNEVFLNNYNVEGGHRQEPPSSLPDVGSCSKNNELLLQTCRSLRDFRETLHSMTHLDEAINHPFLVEYEAKNRIDLLHKLFRRNGDDFHLSGNLCDAASIMAALQRLEQTGAGGGNGTNGNAGGRKTTTMLKTRTTTTMSGRKSEAAAASQGGAGGVPRQMTSSRKALGGIVGSLFGTSEDMGGKHKPTHSEPGMVTRMMSRTTTGAS
eukprot:g3145.t1